MTTALLGDIHGNADALEAVLADIAKDSTITEIRHMGDLVGYGGKSTEVIELIKKHQIQGIMGNHDKAATEVTLPTNWNADPLQTLRITKQMLTSSDKAFLRTLPMNSTLPDGTLLVHGTPPDDIETYLEKLYGEPLRDLMSITNHRIVFVGHMHKLLHFSAVNNALPDGIILPLGVTPLDTNKKHFICVGSVGQPRDHIDKQAKYMVYDSNAQTIEVRAVQYDVAAACDAILRAGFPPNNANRLRS